MEFLKDGYILYITIFFAATVSYIISTLSGGGGSLLLVPVINFVLGAKVTSPVINLGNLIGEPIRLIMFWKYIDWKVTKFYVPPAVIGAISGAFLFHNLKLEWLQIIVGLFLVSTIFQYKFGKKEKSFNMKLKWFIPLGLAIGFFSTLVGAVGPVLNPFFLNYGIEKEQMIATKTANSFLVGLVQISSYTALGNLKGNLWIYGIVLGLGASLGNWIGKIYLKKISNIFFRKMVISIMVISGIIMILKNLN